MGDVVKYGQWLFEALLGSNAWAAIRNAGGNEPIELALNWDPRECGLHSLQWEAMHDGNYFLSAFPRLRVGITRLVADRTGDPGRPPRQLLVTPRVLFVVGTAVTEDSIRPGAEYLGLLRRLEAAGVSLNARIVQLATRSMLKDAVSRFEPSVVHFICHGAVDSARGGYLQLLSEDLIPKPTAYFAEDLLDALAPADRALPTVVVLNACYSAVPPLIAAYSSPAMTEVTGSLAAELVRGGIPIVVGMGGRISDRACRLFTRQFYEAVLKGSSLTAAAAEGRRAGMRDGSDPTATIDWALPTMFLAEDVPDQTGCSDLARFQSMERIAQAYNSRNNPRTFLDRLEFFDAYGDLTGTGAPSAPPVIAIEVADRAQKAVSGQYGKTRLLRELAAQAVRDGYVPCLVTFDNEDPPDNLPDLGLAILEATLVAREQFQLAPPKNPMMLQYAQQEIHAAQTNGSISPIGLRMAISLARRSLQALPDDHDFIVTGALVREALQNDLAELRRAASDHWPSTRPWQVMVFIDDAHRIGTAASGWAEKLLGQNGLGVPGAPVPVVITFTGGMERQGYGTTLRALTDFVSGTRYVRPIPLLAFENPAKDFLPYQQFLLHQQPPLVVRGTFTTQVYEELYRITEGIPSQFLGEKVQTALVTLQLPMTGPVIEVADDEQVLRKMRDY
jgi:hypothetical protein